MLVWGSNAAVWCVTTGALRRCLRQWWRSDEAVVRVREEEEAPSAQEEQEKQPQQQEANK